MAFDNTDEELHTQNLLKITFRENTVSLGYHSPGLRFYEKLIIRAHFPSPIHRYCIDGQLLNSRATEADNDGETHHQTGCTN